MAQKEGIRHKKPLEYSAAALGFLLIQPLSRSRSRSLYGGFPDPGKTVAAAELCQRDDDLALRTTRRGGALGGTRENENLLILRKKPS